MLQAEYYIFHTTDESCTLSWDQESGAYGMGKAVETEEPVKIRIGDPAPQTPKLLDFMKCRSQLFPQELKIY